MARDFRPKEKRSKSAGTVAPAGKSFSHGGSSRPARPSAPPQKSSQGSGRHVSFGETEIKPQAESNNGEADDDEEGNEDELREAIAAMGGGADDFDLISSAALKSKGRKEDQSDDVSTMQRHAFVSATSNN